MQGCSPVSGWLLDTVIRSWRPPSAAQQECLGPLQSARENRGWRACLTQSTRLGSCSATAAGSWAVAWWAPVLPHAEGWTGESWDRRGGHTSGLSSVCTQGGQKTKHGDCVFDQSVPLRLCGWRPASASDRGSLVVRLGPVLSAPREVGPLRAMLSEGSLLFSACTEEGLGVWLPSGALAWAVDLVMPGPWGLSAPGPGLGLLALPASAVPSA